LIAAVEGLRSAGRERLNEIIGAYNNEEILRQAEAIIRTGDD
jgi:phosphopantothenate synthetase